MLIARKPVALEETAARSAAPTASEVPPARAGPDRARTRSPGSIDEVEDVEVGLLVYNAGANTHSEEFLDGDLAEFQKVIDLNITTPLALVHHFGGSMRDRGRGGILLVGSKASSVGSVRHTVYGGVKSFGRIFAEGLWVELREHGVDVLELVLGRDPDAGHGAGRAQPGRARVRGGRPRGRRPRGPRRSSPHGPVLGGRARTSRSPGPTWSWAPTG